MTEVWKYYDENAQDFFDRTVSVDMTENYKPFLDRLPKGGVILDAGCGSGRDSLAFRNMGFNIFPVDASAKMCEIAGEYLGMTVLKCDFEEIDVRILFDGIWASASLLHLSSKELTRALEHMEKFLKPGGVFYASFKYGDFEGEREDRFFHDLKEEQAKAFFEYAGFTIEKMWQTEDVRKDKAGEIWLNVLVSK